MPAFFLHKPLVADRALPSLRRDPGLHVMVPVFEAVRDRRLVMYQTGDRDRPLPFAEFGRQRLPVLVILTDTADGRNGPGEWISSQVAVDWSASAYMYFEAVTAEFFQIVAEETVTHCRFVLIETTGEMVNAWRRLFGARPVKLRSVAAAGA